MILFVFEGIDDYSIMKNLKELYPRAISENIVCTYRNNIYQLYSKMKSTDGDDAFTEMLDFFDDETGNGKLYVSYPMVEALFYTKKLPDSEFYSYSVDLKDTEDFKHLCHEFSDYGNSGFLLYSQRELDGEREKRIGVMSNWNAVNRQNVAKANYICTGVNGWPRSKADVLQRKIFDGQLEKFISCGMVSVLSAYPMFLFEYLKESRL